MNRDDDHSLDQALIAQIANGDTQALERLYDRYATVALTVMLRIVRDRRTAEDLLQELFLQVWRNAAAFDGERGTVRGWLLAIGHNLALNELRRVRRRPQTVQPADDDSASDQLTRVPDPAPLPEDQAWLNDERERVASAMEDLSEQQQIAMRMYAAGYSQSEIATAMNRPLGSVKTWMRRGFIQMRETLEPDRPTENTGTFR